MAKIYGYDKKKSSKRAGALKNKNFRKFKSFKLRYFRALLKPGILKYMGYLTFQPLEKEEEGNEL